MISAIQHEVNMIFKDISINSFEIDGNGRSQQPQNLCLRNISWELKESKLFALKLFGNQLHCGNLPVAALGQGFLRRSQTLWEMQWEMLCLGPGCSGPLRDLRLFWLAHVWDSSHVMLDLRVMRVVGVVHWGSLMIVAVVSCWVLCRGDTAELFFDRSKLHPRGMSQDQNSHHKRGWDNLQPLWFDKES